MVPGFCCDTVHSASLTALHQFPHDENGGIVTVGDCCDTGEGARRWEKDTFH